MYYSENQDALSSALEKLSSGLQINRSADDPSGLAVSEVERDEVTGTNAAVNVIANATNFINTQDGYLQSVNDMLGQMEQLAVSYNDSTLGTSDKTDLNTEFQALFSEMNTNINGQAEYNSVMLFTTNALTFQVGADSADTFTIAGTSNISSLTGVATTLTITLLSNIQAATGNVATARAKLGAAQVQLNYKSTAQMDYSTNMGAAEGRIRNVDVAQESTIYAKEQILVQSSTAMLAQANASPQNVLSLLK